MRSLHGSVPRILFPDGSSARAVADLACERGHPDHAVFVVWHTSDPRFHPGTPAYFERLRPPPEGARYGVRCGHCASSVTAFLGDLPDCVLGAAGVTHSLTCPWLAARLAEAGQR